MAFKDDFIPDGSDDDLSCSFDEDTMNDALLMQPGAEEAADGDSDEVQFMPAGGVAPESARTSAAYSAASSAGAAPACPQKKKRATDIRRCAQRKLIRLTSNPVPESVVAKDLLCLVGYPLKHPVPVHPVKLSSNGKQWIVVNEHQYWLRRACAGRTHYEMHFQAAVTWLRGELQKLISEARKKFTAEGQQGSIRRSLGISDSESEPGSHKGMRKPQHNKKYSCRACSR